MNKTTGVLEHISETDTDICFVQETFLKKNDTAKLAEINDYGFEVISAPRHRCGGGIAVIYRQGIPVSLNKKIEKFTTFEVMEVTLQSDKNLIRFINIYRAPYSKKHRYTVLDFLEEFEQYLQLISNKNGTPILVGDFNIHVQKVDDINSRRFQEILTESSLKQIMPHIPTHEEGGTLDLIITNESPNLVISTPTVIKLGTNSDHFFVCADIDDFKAIKSTNQSKLVNYRKFADIDIKSFRSDLAQSGLLDTSNFRTLDQSVLLLNSVLSSLIDEHCPVINRKVNAKHKGESWFDDDLKNLRMHRRAAERRKRKTDSAENRKLYIDIRSKFNKLVWIKKKSFYQSSLESSLGDKKALFKKINRLLGTEEAELPKCISEAKLAEQFSTYFSSKIDNIRTDILAEKVTSGTYTPCYNSDAADCTFNHFSNLSENDVLGIIKSMPNKFCDLDPIPTWLLKECLTELLPVIHYIINESLMTGSFPQCLKSASIRPTLKSRDMDRDSLKSYRPVSNLSFLAKVLEKCVLKQLSQYLETNDLICDAQSGYRANHSCETLLVRMFDDINNEVDNGNAIGLLLLDLSAAFDTIDHEILVKKLRTDYGIDDNVSKWLSAYLTDRNFTVKVNNNTSSVAKLRYGVPQGSLLGPVLFILYTKDLKKIANNFGLSIQLYADDSQLYISFNPTDTMEVTLKIEAITNCLNEIKQWMVHHFMKLNDDKTKFIVLGKRTQQDLCSELSLPFSDFTIEQTDLKSKVVESLGIKLDQNLSMKRQANDVSKKTFWTLSNLGNFRHYLTEKLKITLVKTLILSKVDYCNALFAGSNKTIVRKLKNVIENAVRFIYNIRDWSVDLQPYYLKCHIMPIELRIQYKVCLLVHKALGGTAPPYMRDLLVLYHENPNKQSLRAYADKRLLLRQSSKETKIRRKMFSYHAPIYWNSLPHDLRHCSVTTMFKRNLKTHYFRLVEHQSTDYIVSI